MHIDARKHYLCKMILKKIIGLRVWDHIYSSPVIILIRQSRYMDNHYYRGCDGFLWPLKPLRPLVIPDLVTETWVISVSGPSRKSLLAERACSLPLQTCPQFAAVLLTHPDLSSLYSQDLPLSDLNVHA